MKRLFQILSEKDRRRYAAAEADKLGYGGTEYIAALFAVDPKTIRRGLADSDEPQDPAGRRILKKRGGRHRLIQHRSELEWAFLAVIAEHTAGDPQRRRRWTKLRPREISQHITAAGISISRRIAELKLQYLTPGWPVISIDTKKKELLGNFYRDGKLYTQETITVLDHDSPSYSDGKIIPHGVYDLGQNKAHVNLGTSHGSNEFSCDSVAHWWDLMVRHDHPQATQLLILRDDGGSNPASSALFQQDLQALANRTGLALRVAHYPAYCSKYHPIEHRVFPYIIRACEGVVFESALVKQLIESTQNCTGLCVTVGILNRAYAIGRKAADHLTTTINIVLDTALQKWNYIISPHPSP